MKKDEVRYYFCNDYNAGQEISGGGKWKK